MQAEERQHHQPLWKTLAKAQVYMGGNEELPPRAIFHDFWRGRPLFLLAARLKPTSFPPARFRTRPLALEQVVAVTEQSDAAGPGPALCGEKGRGAGVGGGGRTVQDGAESSNSCFLQL